MPKDLLLSGPEMTHRVGLLLAPLLREGDVLGLIGNLGAGKTLFTQGVAEGLELPSEVRVTSPTFALINEYRGGRLPIVHMDLYRIEEEKELEHLGLEEHAPLIELQTLRRLDGQPVSLIRHRYCATRAGLLADYQSGSVREFLAARNLALTRTFSLIGARLPSREEASVLLMPRHLPALTVLTLSRDASGQPVEIAHSTSRSDRFQYQIVT